MDRYWLLTTTTYGTWLPGDARGFVGRIKDGPGPRFERDMPGMPYEADLRGLWLASRQLMKGPAIWLKLSQAQALLAQFQETATHRGWLLLAVAVMVNHAHIVVGVPGDPDPEDILRDFKSYGSRALNRRWSKPINGTWWTESGSKRKLPNGEAVCDAIDYVVHRQWRPLVIWENPIAIAERMQ